VIGLRKAGLEEARKHARELKVIGVTMLVFGIVVIITTVFLLGVLIGTAKLTRVEQDLLMMVITPGITLIVAGAVTLYKAIKISGAIREIA
jgi:uncharacterized membrane protein HdeD (DUF308 family)